MVADYQPSFSIRQLAVAFRFSPGNGASLIVKCFLPNVNGCGKLFIPLSGCLHILRYANLYYYMHNSLFRQIRLKGCKGHRMFDYRGLFNTYCSDNKLDLSLPFEMPEGYENANGTFDAWLPKQPVSEEVYRTIFAENDEKIKCEWREVRQGFRRCWLLRE